MIFSRHMISRRTHINKPLKDYIMVRSILNKTIFSISTAALLLISACGTDADLNMGSIEVRLHDAPVDYDEVNVFIERVEINNVDNEEGWIVIYEPNQEYDLLKLTNGAYEVLGNAELEAGTYPQIRLILSQNDHSVVIDGEKHDMKIPGGAQTGIKLQINAEIQGGIEYVLLLDFDASRSVVKTGQDSGPVDYLLKPVIRASNNAVTGNIGGTISPANARPAIYAISESDTISTTFADTLSGEFRLVSLEEGSYTISIEAREEGFESKTMEDVSVTIGETNDLGELELSTSG